MQESAVEAAGEQPTGAQQDEVGGARLLHFAARAEEHLVDAVLAARGEGRAHRCSVVAAGLHATEVRRATLRLLFDQYFERLHAAREVIPHRAREHHEAGLVRGLRGGADVGHGAEEQRPQVQRPRRLRDDVTHAIDERDNHRGHLRCIGLGQQQRAGALLQTRDMAVEPKDLHRTVRMTVGLEALEALAAVVQRVSGRVDGQRTGGQQLRSRPGASTEMRHAHGVGEHAAERRGLRTLDGGGGGRGGSGGRGVGGRHVVRSPKISCGVSMRAFNAWISAAAS